MLNTQLVEFKDPARLTMWVKWFSCFGIFSSIMAPFARYWEYKYYQSLSNGLTTEELASATKDFQEKWTGIVDIFQIPFIFQFVALLMWIYRLNYNTRALCGENMKFTPGWSVGWFFIPIASFWKPYQALKEIWYSNHLSHIPEPDRKKNAKFIEWFWSFWTLNWISGTWFFSTALLFFVKETSQLISLMFLSNFLDIPYYIMSIILVERLYKLQMLKFASRKDEYQQLVNNKDENR